MQAICGLQPMMICYNVVLEHNLTIAIFNAASNIYVTAAWRVQSAGEIPVTPGDVSAVVTFPWQALRVSSEFTHSQDGAWL